MAVADGVADGVVMAGTSGDAGAGDDDDDDDDAKDDGPTDTPDVPPLYDCVFPALRGIRVAWLISP